jgi:hypothetical protein
MRRIVVVGQPAAASGPLCFREFARALALRLGAHQVTRDSPPTVLHDEAWVGAEPAGVFTERLFRQADTIVWLHFSPLAFMRDWAARARDLLRAAARRHGLQPAAPRATWGDIRTAFDYLMIAPEMVALMQHPALAHARVIELRSPRQADFWLMMQRRRSGLAPLHGAGSPTQLSS